MNPASFAPAKPPRKRPPIPGASAKKTFVSQPVKSQPVDLPEEEEVPPASVSVQCSIDGERGPQSLVCTPLQSFSTKYKQQFLRPSK